MALFLSNQTKCLFFFNDTATTEIYTLSLHDALPIYSPTKDLGIGLDSPFSLGRKDCPTDRKSTRLNSSHRCISYAAFCLKKDTTPKSVNLAAVPTMLLTIWTKRSWLT